MRRISMMRMKLSERRKGDPVNPKNQKLPKSLKHQKKPNLKGKNFNSQFNCENDMKILDDL